MEGVPAVLLSGFDEEVILILFLVGLFLVVVPVLAISAFVRVRRLERRGPAGADPSLIARVYSLEQRQDKLESKLASLTAVPPIAAPAEAPRVPAREAPPQAAPVQPPVTLPPPPPPPRVAPSPFPQAAPRAGLGGLDLESLIAGRWLMLLGGLFVLLAAAFFLKYAFENNWIGVRGRVALGLLTGAGLLVASQSFLNRGYKYFSEVIAALGSGVLYLSLYAGWNYYQLFSPGAAFFAMIAVTAAMLAIATGRDSQRLALLALVGGFLTPWLTSTGQNAQVVLFTYVAVLDASLVWLARMREWRSVEPLAFIFTQVYFWGWFDRWYSAPQMLSTIAFATLFLALFAALPVIRTRAGGALKQEQMVVMLANTLLYLLALRNTLWPDHRWALTIAVLVLAALHLLVAQYIPRKKGEAPVVYLLFAGLALLLVTLAIPIRLHGKWITMAWAVEGAVLIWTGFRVRLGYLRAAGLVLFGIAVLRLFANETPAGQFLLNPRFGTFAVTVASFVAALWFANQNREQVKEAEQNWFTVVGVTANVLAVWALSLELYDYYSPARLALGTVIDARLAQQLALSLLWTVYASALIGAGIRWRVAGLRYQALALFFLTIAKVFLYDLGFLQGFYRIVSSLALGLVLLAVAFLYQKVMGTRKSEESK